MPCLPVMQNNTSVAALHRFAPAKINLYLHVTGQRSNGYHELDSLVSFASIGDGITVSRADKLTLEITGSEAEALEGQDASNNLVLKAARVLQDRYAVADGAAIILTKDLPVASGIGGGSADAAATIKALVSLWDIKPVPGELAALALKLGADIPVCLKGRPQRMTGIGENLQEVPSIPVCHIVLVNPRRSQSTPEVFGALHQTKWKPTKIYPAMPADLDFLSLVADLKSRRNDLELPAIKLLPVISDILESLDELPGCRLARMSGSGATCFGLFATEQEGGVAAATLLGQNPDWWVKSARLGDETPDLRQAYTG
jgi:4-diphosphocytidyl-2-C-methyl-D-erythritol kinase